MVKKLCEVRERLLGGVLSYQVADPNGAAAYDSCVSSAKMKRCPLFVVCKRAGLWSVASGEFRAAGMGQVAKLNDYVIPDGKLAAGWEIGFAEVEIDDHVIAGQAHPVVMVGDLAEKAGVHQLNLAARI